LPTSNIGFELPPLPELPPMPELPTEGLNEEELQVSVYVCIAISSVYCHFKCV
jgi:hypothetical protein